MARIVDMAHTSMALIQKTETTGPDSTIDLPSTWMIYTLFLRNIFVYSMLKLDHLKMTRSDAANDKLG